MHTSRADRASRHCCVKKPAGSSCSGLVGDRRHRIVQFLRGERSERCKMSFRNARSRKSMCSGARAAAMFSGDHLSPKADYFPSPVHGDQSHLMQTGLAVRRFCGVIYLTSLFYYSAWSPFCGYPWPCMNPPARSSARQPRLWYTCSRVQSPSQTSFCGATS